MLLIEAPSGLIFQQQCNGLECDVRSAEGFLIPIHSRPEMEDVYALFESGRVSREALKHALGELSVCLNDDWQAPWTSIELDEERFDQALEAWVPVRVGEMHAYLIWCNSD